MTKVSCSDRTADGSTADGTRRSTGDTQKMGENAGTRRWVVSQH